MKITTVERQKKNTSRFNVFLDGQFAFGADEDTVVNNRLIIGREISQEDLQKILLDTEVGKLMERMYRLFGMRQRSEREVRDYLRRLSFQRKVKDKEELTEVVVEALIDNLKRKEMINDEAFARTWVESRRRTKQKGDRIIRAELMQKGVDRETIEEIFNQSEESADPNALATKALEKKMKSWRGLEKQDFTKKGLEFLMRRGFDYDVSKAVVSDAWNSLIAEN
jgi:regulatory protein